MNSIIVVVGMDDVKESVSYIFYELSALEFREKSERALTPTCRETPI
jgi:hypothetical protein